MNNFVFLPQDRFRKKISSLSRHFDAKKGKKRDRGAPQPEQQNPKGGNNGGRSTGPGERGCVSTSPSSATRHRGASAPPPLRRTITRADFGSSSLPSPPPSSHPTFPDARARAVQPSSSLTTARST